MTKEGVNPQESLHPHTGNLLLSLGYASAASDSHMVNAGLTYRFGGGSKPASRLNLQAKYESVVAENRSLTARVDALTTQNDSIREQNAAIIQQNQSLKAEIEAIKTALKLK